MKLNEKVAGLKPLLATPASQIQLQAGLDTEGRGSLPRASMATTHCHLLPVFP